METNEHNGCRELANSSSFQQAVFKAIAVIRHIRLEEVGWEHLVNLAGDLKFLSFRVTDKKGEVHILEVQLDKTYPNCPPSVSADVPYIFILESSKKCRLKDLVQQFREHLKKLQEFWSTLDDIDNSLCVVNLIQPSGAMSFRQIDRGNGCLMMLFINVKDPLYQNPTVNTLRKLWQRNRKLWMKDRTFQENLIQLPKPHDIHKNDQQVECGIYYAHCLPADDELGPRSGTGTDYTCENSNCNRAFHSICLVDRLLSITTRQSFNILFGNCPYCSKPVALKTNNAKHYSTGSYLIKE